MWHWRLLRTAWTARRSHQSVLKEINPEYSLEGLMLKLKLQYFGHRCKEPTHWKRPWCWERLRAGGEGGDREEMVWWHHQLNGHEFEQTPGDSEGQGSLACHSPWGLQESELSKWTTTTRYTLYHKVDGWFKIKCNLSHPIRADFLKLCKITIISLRSLFRQSFLIHHPIPWNVNTTHILYICLCIVAL